MGFPTAYTTKSIAGSGMSAGGNTAFVIFRVFFDVFFAATAFAPNFVCSILHLKTLAVNFKNCQGNLFDF
jgi:hypothetical protein